ncbi:MAG TPA: imidazoleglycerol-phosphate dehydratase HisB [Candidatus Acidoferrum sp.]|nr:imidazoleglycerol-phosphate dehydratase HisB [Candidatus Acidoferrum sp.]
MRSATVERKTAETDIRLTLALDGAGKYEGKSGSGFFDHMLSQLAKHGGMDITLAMAGDTEVDFHHSAEDVGIVLGCALDEALGDRRGVARFADCHIPMDECLTRAAVDLSGRGYFVWSAPAMAPAVGGLDTEIFPEFFRAFAVNAKMALHLSVLYGANTHHMIESAFKAAARAILAAKAVIGDGLPSTKGVL